MGVFRFAGPVLSMRVGAAQDLLSSGASMPIIMQRGRWSKTDTVMRYVERLNNL
ncbi:hypothetical protein G6700_01825 [Polynucleobacter paneuropaeus]|nr:hypothetical protein G6700_01825 [Polynucleobacter paneuropaeus]